MNQNTFLEKVADKITDLDLIGPAIFLLEVNKPLAFLGSQLGLVAQPVLNAFFSPSFTQNSIDLLADSAQLDQLITVLERRTMSESTVKGEARR
ncbi:MAG: hypothetical protein JXM69_06555 [Anaerolineae bacterium]|nr:hypothetical protein [Anaerolineae bacterium]